MSPTATLREVSVAGRCLACGDDAAEALVRLDGLPVLTTELWDRPERARGVPRGDLDLRLCPRCGLVWNAAFDEALVDYTPAYENSLHWSPTFQRYAQALARRLVATHALSGRVVMEIGCGHGDFLAMLCEAGARRGLGYDPSVDAGDALPAGVTIEPRYYRSTDPGVTADLVCARHVLEHVPDPLGLLTQLGGVRPADGRALAVYVEVPNAEFVLSPAGMWDLIYQHVTYFSPAALHRLVQQAGFAVARLEASFEDQFLGVDATTRSSARISTPAPEVAPFVERARRFPALLREAIQGWQAHVAADGGDGTVLWGAGAKGVTFLNLVDPDRRVDGVVDLNPRKWGRYVPGTGHRVLAPGDLTTSPPTTIAVVNAVYLDEVRRMAGELGLDSDVVALQQSS